MRRLNVLFVMVGGAAVNLNAVFNGKDPRCVELENALGLADEDVVIGTVANLKRVKNHLFLLQPFARVAEENERVKLLVVGQGFKGETDKC